MKKVKKLIKLISVLKDWAAVLSALVILVSIVGLFLRDDVISALWIYVGILLAINSIVTKILYMVLTKEMAKEVNCDLSV